jgi:membrane protease YdiL (CAAX protease family)
MNDNMPYTPAEFARSETFAPIPDPNNPPWNTPAAIGVWLASVLFILLLPNLIVLPYLVNQHIDLSSSAELLDFLLSDPTAVLLNVLAIIPAHALTLLLAWIVVTRFRRFPFRETLGWRSGGMKWWYYAAILGSFFLIALLIGSYFPEQDNDLLRILRSSRLALYIVAFLATFTAPIVEEVIYRGVLYSAVQRTAGMPLAIVIVTVLFALVHVPQYYPSYSTIFLLTLLSLVLTTVRAMSKNLLPCIILHFVFNGLQSLLLVLEPVLPKDTAVPVDSAALVHLLIK